MATWTKFSYGFDGPRQAEHWVPGGVPAVATGRPCLIFIAGDGWNGRDPSAFYEDDALFTDHIEPAEFTEPVVVISTWAAGFRYDRFASGPSLDDWDVGHGTYDPGDIVEHSSSAWRCLKSHTASAPLTPGAAGAVFTWYELQVNDIGNAQYGKIAPMTPGFVGQGTRDLQDLVQFLKENADHFGIDPTKIVLMGTSVGAVQAGAAAFARSAPYFGEDQYPAAGSRYTRRESSNVQGVLLSHSPNDWTWFPWIALMEQLFGEVYTDPGTWRTDVPDQVKAALSPLGTVKETRKVLPTYLRYAGSRFDHVGGTDDPPYTTGMADPFHHARNGWEILKFLETLGAPDVVFVEDDATATNYERWTSTTDSTIVTDFQEDAWEWLRALWGF